MKAALSWVVNVSGRFEPLDEFVQEVEDHIEQLSRRQQRNVAAADSQERYDIETDRLASIQEAYPRLLRYGAVFTVYAEVEAVLIELCEEVQRRLKVPFTVHDVVGHEFDRYDRYLQQTVGVLVKKKERTFSKEVNLMAKVRHGIAHVAGHVPSVKNPAALGAALRELGLGVSGDYIMVPKDATRRLVEQAKTWLYELVGDVEHALDALAGARRIRKRLRAWAQPPFRFEDRSQPGRLIFGVSGSRSMLLTAQPSMLPTGDYYLSVSMCDGPLPPARFRGEDPPSTPDRYSFSRDEDGVGWRRLTDRRFLTSKALLDHYVERLVA